MDHYLSILDQIQEAKRISDRIVDPIDILAVIKNQNLEKIKTIIQQGISIVGENRVQDATLIFPQLEEFKLQKHLIGSLQRNKENTALKFFDTIQSIESLDQLQRIIQKIRTQQINKNIFIQVNTSHEDSKHGVSDVTELFNMVEYMLSHHDHVLLQGLMTIGTHSSNEKNVRRSFEELRELRDQLLVRFPEIPSLKLSMGMSNDFHWAIQEGSDMIRIGKILFDF
ncbi:MAG: YggS family pyridoxal phosphate-dependent enzyme [Brevinema sp.]